MADPQRILDRPEIFGRPGQERRLLEAGWRFQLIGRLLDEGLSRMERQRIWAELTSHPVDHPWRGSVRLGARTLRRWCQRYRNRGLAGLVPVQRKDRGRIQALPEGALTMALELREEDPRRTVPQLIRILVAEKPEWHGHLKRSTLDRHLRSRGSVRQLKVTPEGPFRAFEAKGPMDLVQGDILQGPVAMLDDGKLVKTRIVCYMDDHSRHVLHLEAYPDERQASIEDALRKAILKYGTPAKLFVDNAWVYSGTTFTLTCSQLGIVKIHSTPRYPVSRGKQERLFGTLRQQLLDEMENLEPMPLAQMNRYLVAWVDRYHHTPHSRTQQTPHVRFAGRPHRMPPLDQFEEAFWQWETRAISALGEIKFMGNVYHVDSSLATKKAVIRYDPNDLSRIYLWKDGRKVATASAHELIHQYRRGRPMPGHARSSKAALNYLNQLEQSHRQRLARELNLTEYHDKLEDTL